MKLLHFVNEQNAFNSHGEYRRRGAVRRELLHWFCLGDQHEDDDADDAGGGHLRVTELDAVEEENMSKLLHFEQDEIIALFQ